MHQTISCSQVHTQKSTTLQFEQRVENKEKGGVEVGRATIRYLLESIAGLFRLLIKCYENYNRISFVRHKDNTGEMVFLLFLLFS
mmetsp:Transcript_4686/g.9809  ORF Transcript_4686/g.9809 Transcript_4686/m.9809 type:complete len:85 (-) Transcript_4686:19-273(-)